MAFIGSTSKIKNTQNRSESVAETFCACSGHSGLSFKKRIKLDKFGHRWQFDFKESKTLNAYSS